MAKGCCAAIEKVSSSRAEGRRCTSTTRQCVEDACSAPQSLSFWDTIFADMSQNGGLAVFKQDHGGGEIVQLVAAQRNLSVMENWLGPQGRAAAKVSRF